MAALHMVTSSIAANPFVDRGDGTANEAVGGNGHGGIEPPVIMSKSNLSRDLIEFKNGDIGFPTTWLTMIEDRGNVLEYGVEKSPTQDGKSRHRRTDAAQLLAEPIGRISKANKRLRRKKRERSFDADGRPSDPSAHEQQPLLPTLQESGNTFSTIQEVLLPHPNINDPSSNLSSIVYQCPDHIPELAFETQAALASHCMRDHQIPYRICDYATCQLIKYPSNRETEATVTVPKFAGSDLELKDHLREYHKEDISQWEKFSSREKKLLYECSIEAEWWRCRKCLSRIFIEKDGYVCKWCNQPCDPLRVKARKNRFKDLNSVATPGSNMAVILDGVKGRIEANHLSDESFIATESPPTTSVLSWKMTGPKLESSSLHFPGNQFQCHIEDCPAKGISFDSEDYKLHTRNVHSGLELYNCDYMLCMFRCTAFSRKYHLRNHIRDYHNEDINVPPPEAPEYKDWASQRNISSRWWRCRECLKRVSVAIDGWDCNDCRRPCDPERLILRKAFPNKSLGTYQLRINSRSDNENSPGPDMDKSSNSFPLILTPSFHGDSTLKSCASPPTDADPQSDLSTTTTASASHTTQSQYEAISPEAKTGLHQIESITNQQKVIRSVLEESYDVQSTPLDGSDPSVNSLGMFRCEHPSCWDTKDKFRFHVFLDLVRHYNEAHPSVMPVEAFFCDYLHTCGRSKDPFDRKDSYRDHLREFHQEDLTRRHKNLQRQQSWLATRTFSLQWWRCIKCLRRIFIDKEGWLCKKCNEPCELVRIALRKLPPASHGVLSEGEEALVVDSTNLDEFSSESTIENSKIPNLAMSPPLDSSTTTTRSKAKLPRVHFGLIPPPLSEPVTPYPSRSEYLSASELSAGQKREVAVVEFIHKEYQTSKTIPFTTIKQLGHGSLGSVDAVRQQDDDEETVYARKIIRLPNMARKRLLPLIQQEVKVLRELTHMHIVKVISTYETLAAPRQFGILLFPAGDEDLCHYLEHISEQFANEDIENLKSWPYCLASAVSYIHSQNIRHKDIKPSNIICKGDQVFLTDFGSAHQFSTGLTSSTEGYALGITKMYSAPEVIAEDRRGRPADVYSLGCVFAEISTVAHGRRIEDFHEFRTEPVPDDPQQVTIAYHATAHKLREWFTMQDDWMPSLIAKMMEIDQKLRPTALEVLDYISGYSPPSCACAQIKIKSVSNFQLE
ncbi:hypothetical protein B7494_g6661 [Chlorociboria aeruginascens]|nr:hypothetical protein B7494_g6661 [Chlorociboria aeruginascens]